MTRPLPPPALLAAIALALATPLALAASVPGWSPGTLAAGLPAISTVDMTKAPVLTLPPAIARKVHGTTLLFYFGPDCTHCQDDAPEIAALAAKLGKKAHILAIATARSTPEEVAEFQKTYGWSFDAVIDSDAGFATTMGARSTPAAFLVTREGSEIREIDRWFPYAHGDAKLVQMRVNKEPWSTLVEGGYLGNKVCGSCHTQELRSWELTQHGVAWRSLILSGGSRDPECTDCHVTGAKQPGGWAGVGEKWLVDVGCEQCHGPSGPHDGVVTDASGACAQCHDPKHSIAFNYPKGLPLIDHYAANALDDAAFDAALKELRGGETTRPLLAFAEGRYVGSAACGTCHTLETGTWATSGHAWAMTPLVVGKQAADVACVRCHASPTISGPLPTQVEQYATQSGVGCESCHGPGGMHVDAGGGKGNIVGLGDSCPVCVLQGVCTSCHTTKWDPDWNLTESLARIAHPRTTVQAGAVQSPPGAPPPPPPAAAQ